MPSEKSLRVARRKAVRTKALKSAAKTAVTATRRAVASGQATEAEAALARAASALDLAAKKGPIHSNAVARRKSRLARQLNAIRPQTAPPPPP